MKKFTFTLLLLSCFLLATAQENQKSYYEKMKILTRDLDSTKFVNNILYDRVFPLANLKYFNQGIRQDTSRYDHFLQSVSELKISSNENLKFYTPDKFEQFRADAYEKHKTLIGILNVDITTLKDNTWDTSNPLMLIDSTEIQKKIVPVINKNPYENKQSLVISTLSNKIEQGNTPLVFSFEKVIFQKTINKIKNLYIDFGNGQNQQIINNGLLILPNISHTFSNSGIKTFVYTGNFNNGITFKTYSKYLYSHKRYK